MIVFRCIRPDKVILAVTNFVMEKLDLVKSYNDSCAPLIFSLSPGWPYYGAAQVCGGQGFRRQQVQLSLSEAFSWINRSQDEHTGGHLGHATELPYGCLLDDFCEEFPLRRRILTSACGRPVIPRLSFRWPFCRMGWRWPTSPRQGWDRICCS